MKTIGHSVYFKYRCILYDVALQSAVVNEETGGDTLVYRIPKCGVVQKTPEVKPEKVIKEEVKEEVPKKPKRKYHYNRYKNSKKLDIS